MGTCDESRSISRELLQLCEHFFFTTNSIITLCRFFGCFFGGEGLEKGMVVTASKNVLKNPRNFKFPEF